MIKCTHNKYLSENILRRTFTLATIESLAYLPWVVLLFCTVTTNAQVDSLKHSKRLRITPLPVIYYSPETRLGFGAFVGANFETIKVPDSVTKSSYAQTYFLYTINKQYEWGTSVRLYFPHNKFIINGKFNYRYFPEYYFGVSTEDPQMKKDTIEYNRVSADVRFYYKTGRNLYLGLATRFNRITDVSGRPDGSLSNDQPLGYRGYWIQGFAPAFTIETRDNFVYPRKGFYLEALYFIYPSWSSNSYFFRSFKLDARKYFPLKWISKIDAFAIQFLVNINSGDVPFKDMAEIGGANTMRGYYTGFYRYNNLYAIQAEYRTHFWWRLGMTIWVGGAATSDVWYKPFEHSLRPNAGIGLRIMMNKKDRLNVRADFGMGNKNQAGFYLDIAEAY